MIEKWHELLRGRGLESMYTYSAGDVSFTDHRKYGRLLGFPEELNLELDQLVGEVASDPEWAALYGEASLQIMEGVSHQVSCGLYHLWHNMILEQCPEDGGLRLLLFFTGNIHRMAKWYEEHGLGEDVLRENLRDLYIWADHYHRHTGKWGLQEGGWLIHTFRHRLFRIGRLQYMEQPYALSYCILRHRGSGELAALSLPGQALSADGMPGSAYPVVKTVLEEQAEGWLGHPAADYKISLTPQYYPKTEWEQLITGEDTVLDMHIPEDGPLVQEDCRLSMERAKTFYKTLFGTTVSAYTVTSWLMDEALRGVLRETSNIRHFQDLYTLRLPTPLGQSQTVQRVFGDRWQGDVLHAPETTSLQKNVKRAILSGAHFHEYSGFTPAAHP